MKKILLLSALFILNIALLAQIQPFDRQYLFDQTAINPAFGVKYDYLTVKLIATDQWTQLPANPKIATLMFNYKFNKKKTGINATLMGNSYGSVDYTGLKFSYFYFSKINVEGDYFSLGIYGSLFNYSFNVHNTYVENPNDPAILNSAVFSKFIPNVGFGGLYNQEYFTLSLSVGNAYLIKFSEKLNSFNPPIEPSIFAYFDLKFANEIKTVQFIPSLMFRMNTKLGKEINLNAKMLFNQKYWFALSYRDALKFDLYSIHNVNLILGIRIMKKFEFGYSYDLGILSVRSVLGGTHSVYLGYYMLKNRRDVPMFF